MGNGAAEFVAVHSSLAGLTFIFCCSWPDLCEEVSKFSIASSRDRSSHRHSTYSLSTAPVRDL